MIKSLKFIFGLLTPRFEIDYVAMRSVARDEYEPICIIQDLEDGERPDVVAKVKVFTWLNKAWPLKSQNLSCSWVDYQSNAFGNLDK